MNSRKNLLCCLGILFICAAGITLRAQNADRPPANDTPAEVSAGAREAVSRQLAEAGRGMLELVSFKVDNSLTREGVSSIEYSGEARLLEEAALWNDETHTDGSLTDLAHFMPVPTVASLKGKLEKGRICQLWPKGAVFPFSGKTTLRKFDEGWRAFDVYGGYGNHGGFEKESEFSGTVRSGMRPSKFIIFQRAADGTIREVRSNKAGIIIAEPTDAQLRAAFSEALASYSQGLQTVESFAVTKRTMEPQDGYGSTSEFFAEFKATLVLARPAISKSGYDFVEVPRVGDTVKAQRWGEPQEVTAPHWEAGGKFVFVGKLELNKETTGETWKEPRIRELVKDGDERFTAPRMLRIRYKFDENRRELVVNEVEIVEKQ